MLLFPLGHSETTVRRHPWVSWTLIAACVAIHLYLALTGMGDRSQVVSLVTRAAEMALTRPYLEIPEPLAPVCDEACAEDRSQRRARMAWPAPDQVAREQEELDALVAEAWQLRDDLPSRRWGFVPAQREWSRTFTYVFLHGDLLHLLGNMYFLFLTAPFIEDRFGRALFGSLYFGSGLLAAALHASFFPQSDVSLIGASGAIAGVMGAFLVRLAAVRIEFLVLPTRWRVRLPAFVVLPLWLAQQLYEASSQQEAFGVAWFAHVGGFLFGVGFAGVMKLMAIEEHYIHPGIERRIGITQDPRLEQAMEARLAGDLVTARRLLQAVLVAQPGHLDALRESYELALAAADPKQSAAAAQRLLEAYARADEHGLLAGLVREVAYGGGQAPARFLQAAAAYLEKKPGDEAFALDLYQQITRHHPADPLAFRAWVRRGDLARKLGDAGAARAAYSEALKHPACPEPMRERLAGLAGRPVRGPASEAPAGPSRPAPARPGNPRPSR